MSICWALPPGHPYTARFEHPFSFKRRETPRVRIPGGSIVVQLGLSDIIPFDQPCGWNIIGSTPLLACDYRKENPFLLKAGAVDPPCTSGPCGVHGHQAAGGAGLLPARTYEKEG